MFDRFRRGLEAALVAQRTELESLRVVPARSSGKEHMKVPSKMALLVVALAGLTALAAGAVYAISIEVPARGTFVTNKDKVELARGVARLIGEPPARAGNARHCRRLSPLAKEPSTPSVRVCVSCAIC